MTPDERIKEIEERVKAATEGPWIDVTLDKASCGGWRMCGDKAIQKAPSGALIQSKMHTSSEAVIQASNYDDSPWMLPEDRTFIAHAREDIPWLIERVKELEKALRLAREENIAVRQREAAS